jgi:hypothetical protein
MKRLYLVSVMLVCAVVGLACGLNLYAYLDLGLKFGIGGCLYALVLLLAAGLFLRALMVFIKSLAAKK